MTQHQFIEITISNHKTIITSDGDRHSKPHTNYILDISLQSDKNPQEIIYQWSLEYRYSKLRRFHSLLSIHFKQLPTFPPKKLFNRSPDIIEKRLVQLNYYFKQLCKNRNDIFNKLGTFAFILKFINIPNELEQYIKVKDDQLKSTDTDEGLRYKLMKFIGNGAFGKVFHCIDEDGREYAIKEIPALYVDTTYVENNAKLISECNETFLRYILRILDSFQIGSQYYVITEYFNKGSLINIRNDLKMSVSTILQIIVQMVTSLRFLNSKKMVHLDIKEGNIFVQSFNDHRIVLILGDLGLCRKVNPTFQAYNHTMNDNKNKNAEISNDESLFGSLSSSESIGTPLYQAPEIVQQENPFIHEKSDIYSLGCTILYYLFGKNEVLNEEKKLDWEKINSLFQKLKEPEWKYINELLQKMLAVDVKERADTKTILDFIFKKEVTPSEMSEETNQLDEMENIDLLTSYVKLQDYFKTSDSLIRDSLYENGNQFEYIPEHFKVNRNYFNIAAQQNSMLHNKSDQFKFHLSLAATTESCKNEITLLKKNSSEQNRNDYYFALSSVSKKGETLQFVGYNLKMNRQIVMVAVKQNPLAIQYAPTSLRKDKEIAKEALVYNGKILEYLSEELQDDEEIVMSAVSVHGMALKFASPRLRAQENIIRRAVKVDGYAIECADISNLSLKLLFEIVCQNFEACELLKYDKKLVIEYVKQTNDSNAKAFLLLNEKKVSMSKMIQLADDTGNSIAQLYVAMHKKDPERLFDAAQQDNLQAQFICACWLHDRGNVEKAMVWFKSCASYSYLPAIIFLCSLIDNPTVDYEWFLKGSHFGDAEIQYVYGFSILKEIDKNPTHINYQGFYWCKRSARQGYPKAQYHISQCYKYGFGVNRNPEKTFKWTKLAAENQVIVAQQQLGLLYGDGYGTVSDLKKAFYWLELSAKKKNWVSFNELGLIYLKGKFGVKVNYDKAIEYFKKSLQTLEDYKNTPTSDDFDAYVNPPKGKGEYIYLNIGECYFLKKKHDQGVEWMMKSVSLGCAYAVERLEDYTGMVVSTTNDEDDYEEEDLVVTMRW